MIKLPKLDTSTNGMLFGFSTALAFLFAILNVQAFSPEYLVIFLVLIVVMISSYRGMKRGK